MSQSDSTGQDLRVSDAERDAVATELGQHLQDGRLDQAEFDARVTAALSARTRGDLNVLLTDLPRGVASRAADAAPPPARPGGPTRSRARAFTLLPLLIVVAVIAAGAACRAVTGGWHHGWPFAPFGFLWLILVIVAVRVWTRGGRRRQWR